MIQALFFAPSFRWAAPLQAASCAGSLFALRGFACAVRGDAALSEAARVLCLAATGVRSTLVAGIGGDPRIFEAATAPPSPLCDERAMELLLALGAALACFLSVRGRKGEALRATR